MGLEIQGIDVDGSSGELGRFGQVLGAGCLHSNSCHSDLGSLLNAQSDVTGWREAGSNSVLTDQKEGFK